MYRISTRISTRVDTVLRGISTLYADLGIETRVLSDGEQVLGRDIDPELRDHVFAQQWGRKGIADSEVLQLEEAAIFHIGGRDHIAADPIVIGRDPRIGVAMVLRGPGIVVVVHADVLDPGKGPVWFAKLSMSLRAKLRSLFPYMP